MTPDPIEYLSSAIQRIASGDVNSKAGSHIAGIFGKAANDFEKLIRAYLAELLRTCRLNYDADIRSKINGPGFAKLTLGTCIAAIKEVSRVRYACVVAGLPAGRDIGDWLSMLTGINSAWVNIKHGDDLGPAVLLKEMRTMIVVGEQEFPSHECWSYHTDPQALRAPTTRNVVRAEGHLRDTLFSLAIAGRHCPPRVGRLRCGRFSKRPDSSR